MYVIDLSHIYQYTFFSQNIHCIRATSFKTLNQSLPLFFVLSFPSSMESSATSGVANTTDSESLLSINMLNVTKLSSVNYLTWSIQIRYLLRGYDLVKFIDTSTTPPSPTLTSNGVESPDPVFTPWQRQDCLLYSALIGTIEMPLQPLIASATTTLEAWKTLASTYAKPTRGHIKQLKQQLKHCVKGTKTIDEFMQQIKIKSDALALLGSRVDPEDLTDIILDGLGEEYKSVVDSAHSRDVPIPFAELHQKLLNQEIEVSTTQH